MSDYQQRMDAFAVFGPDAIVRIVEDHSELFLSVSETEASEKIVAAMKLRNDLPIPRSDNEAYEILAKLLGELLGTGKINLPEYGLSTFGENEYNSLVARAFPPPPVERSTDPKDVYADVIAAYRSGAVEFARRRKAEPDFRKRSDEAQTLGILR